MELYWQTMPGYQVPCGLHMRIGELSALPTTLCLVTSALGAASSVCDLHGAVVPHRCEGVDWTCHDHRTSCLPFSACHSRKTSLGDCSVIWNQADVPALGYCRQDVLLDDLTPQRILFGFFPTYRASPLQPAFDRVLQVRASCFSRLKLPHQGLPRCRPCFAPLLGARSSVWRLSDSYKKALGSCAVQLKCRHEVACSYTRIHCTCDHRWEPCSGQIGDASGIQSPLSFGGFGAMTRHLRRLTNAVNDAVQVLVRARLEFKSGLHDR
jgi:hypothetical protein